MRRKKALVAGISAAALAVTLAACGGSGSDGSSSDGFNNVEGAGGKNPDAKGPAPEVSGAKTGGDITVLAPDPDDGPTSLDPAGLWSVTDNAIAQDLLFRSLTTWQQDPDTGEYTLVPDLATDLGTPNSDYTEWTFTLKDGIKWENGDPVTADEVKFGMERSFDADTFATGPGTSYSKPYFLGGDKYSGPYAAGAKDFPAITVDGNTLTLKMAKPFPEMDYYGIFPAMGPVPLDAKAPDYGLKPLSTGPYKIQSYEPNQKLVLVKNDQWDPASDPARHQYADSFTFEFGGDPTVAAKTVESDSGSTTLVTNIEGQDYTAAKQSGNDANFTVGPQPCTSFVMPNYDKVKELQVRQALAFAYPYEDVWSAGGELPGVTRANGVTDDTLGFGLLPPGMAGRKAWNPEIDGETIQYDPDHAKALLKEAGYDPGQYEVSFVYDATTPQGKAAAEQRKLGYEKSGFSVKMYPYTAGSLYDVWTDPDNKLYKKINLLGTAWCQDWPSAATFVPPILETGAAYNTGNFSEKSVDDEMNRIRTLPIEQQADAWGELENKAMSDYQPVINVGFYQGIFGVGTGIGGFNNDTTVGGAPDYRTTYVK
jgi:peptide/nickel transport system substrate-binding protein